MYINIKFLKNNLTYSINKKSSNYIKSKDSDEWTKDVYHSYDYEYDDLGRLICKKGTANEYKDATITINKNINYYKNSNLPYQIIYNVNSKAKSDKEASADIIYENFYEKGNIIKFKETGNRFLQNPKNADSLKTTPLEEVTISYEYDDNNRIIKEINLNGDTFIYSYDVTSGMVEKVSKNNNIIKTLSCSAGKLTKVNNDDIIYNSYGDITAIGNTTFIYNSRNLLESYINNDNVSFEYSYQGIRYKKRSNNYETNYYLDENRIIGEDVIDANTHQIIRKLDIYMMLVEYVA